jgi:hypothetical protein
MKKQLEKDDAADDDGILKDGEMMRTPLVMMDALQRRIAGAAPTFDVALCQPGPRFSTDAHERNAIERNRQKLYGEAERRLCDAWRSPAAIVADQQRAAEAPLVVGDARANAYAAYEKRISEAWKTR